MYEKKIHLVSVPGTDHFPEELEEGDGIDIEADDKQERICNDGDDLGIAKYQVFSSLLITFCYVG